MSCVATANVSEWLTLFVFLLLIVVQEAEWNVKATGKLHF
jgi:hypothetical protein